ncbi:MAG TPA: glycosyltransferase family 4 protein [Polyangiaceae bacterium]|nr:glycosyltransferase family 4 protein [Polyangiaceae bacterium]
MARVAFVTTSFPAFEGDAAGHFVLAEVRDRAASGDDVLVLAPGVAPGTGEVRVGSARVEWLGASDAFGFPGALPRLREKPSRLVGATAFAVRAQRALARFRPDVTVAHFIVPSAWPIASFGCGVLEVVAHGSDVRLLARLPRPVRVAIVRSLLRRGATFRFVSNELAERLAHATTRELLTRSRVAPSPIDLYAAPDRRTARAALDIDERELVCVVVGRLIAEKRVDASIELAFGLSQFPHALLENEGAYRVVVVGGGPLAGELRSRYPSVEFVGQLPRGAALAWIAGADVLVSASRDEGAPTAIREARALGVPVVAVPAGDLREWAARDPGITLVEARATRVSDDRAPFLARRARRKGRTRPG